jgi:hypothetical protein
MMIQPVKTCRPHASGGWLCLLACGCEAHIDVGPRPRRVEHTCEPELPILPEPADHIEFETRYADQEHENESYD